MTPFHIKKCTNVTADLICSNSYFFFTAVWVCVCVGVYVGVCVYVCVGVCVCVCAQENMNISLWYCGVCKAALF